MPGEAALVIGDAFEGNWNAVVKLVRPSGARTEYDPISAPVIQRSSSSFKVVIPHELPVGIYELSIPGLDGDRSIVLNRPTIYWIQGDQGQSATARGWIRIFGRAISLNGKLSVRLISEESSRSYLLESDRATLWEGGARLSDQVEAGQYRVEIQDLSETWITAGKIRVTTIESRGDQFNVVTFGAVGDGAADDSAAINRAIRAAASKGGEVYFPSGRYRVTEALKLPPKVYLVGERADVVNIFWPDMPNPPKVLIEGTRDFGLKELTLYASNYGHFLSNDVPGEDLGNVEISHVVIRANPYRGHLVPDEIDRRFRAQLKIAPTGGDLIRLRGSNLRVEDSDLYGSMRSIGFFGAKGAYVARNRLYNGRLGWYSMTGPNGVIFEDNIVTGADLQAAGGGVNALAGFSSAENVYFGNNRFELFHGLDREAFTSDAGYGNYYGYINGVKGRVVELGTRIEGRGSELSGWKGAGLFILGGRGMGQFVRAEDFDPKRGLLTLERPFAVDPDKTSIVTVVPLQQNFILYKNTFVDTGVAIQYYGTSVNHIAAENVLIRSGGIFSFGRWYQHYQPSWYCQFYQNRIAEGNIYRGGPNNSTESGVAIIGSFGLQRPPNTAPLSIGAIHRRNSIATVGEFRFEGLEKNAPGLVDVVVEVENLERDSKNIRIDDGVARILVRQSPQRPK